MKKGIRRYFIILIVIIVCIVTLVDCTNTQTRREERTSASHLIINWENEVQIFDADAMENTGMVENIETLAWIAPRGGAGIDTVGIEQIQSQNEYIVESSQYLNQDKEIINTEGFDTWVRVVQEQVMPTKETSETGHGDYLIYKGADYQAFMQNYLGATLNFLDPDTVGEIYMTQEYIDMDTFPGANSTRVVDGILYVKTENCGRD